MIGEVCLGPYRSSSAADGGQIAHPVVNDGNLHSLL